MTLAPCLECGEPTDGSRCALHQPPAPAKAPAGARGYDWTWQQLSRRARRLQPWCTDCGSRDDLTTDHSEHAWKRKAAGKPIRLADVDVLCRSCNAKRGRARPTGDNPRHLPPNPPREADFPIHTPGGYL